MSYQLNGFFAIKNHRYAVVDYEQIKDIKDVKESAIENINVYLIKADKLSELCSNAENLSYNYHFSHLRHPYWDFRHMQLMRPANPNAYKFELNLSDMLEFVEKDKFGVLVVPREDEYAPVVYADSMRKSQTLVSSRSKSPNRVSPYRVSPNRVSTETPPKDTDVLSDNSSTSTT